MLVAHLSRYSQSGRVAADCVVPTISDRIATLPTVYIDMMMNGNLSNFDVLEPNASIISKIDVQQPTCPGFDWGATADIVYTYLCTLYVCQAFTLSLCTLYVVGMTRVYGSFATTLTILTQFLT